MTVFRDFHEEPDVTGIDGLAAAIREGDGGHSLGAAALAEALWRRGYGPRLSQTTPREDDLPSDAAIEAAARQLPGDVRGNVILALEAAYAVDRAALRGTTPSEEPPSLYFSLMDMIADAEPGTTVISTLRSRIRHLLSEVAALRAGGGTDQDDVPYDTHTVECQKQAERDAGEGEEPMCVCGATAAALRSGASHQEGA